MELHDSRGASLHRGVRSRAQKHRQRARQRLLRHGMALQRGEVPAPGLSLIAAPAATCTAQGDGTTDDLPQEDPVVINSAIGRMTNPSGEGATESYIYAVQSNVAEDSPVYLPSSANQLIIGTAEYASEQSDALPLVETEATYSAIGHMMESTGESATMSYIHAFSGDPVYLPYTANMLAIDNEEHETDEGQSDARQHVALNSAIGHKVKSLGESANMSTMYSIQLVKCFVDLRADLDLIPNKLDACKYVKAITDIYDEGGTDSSSDDGEESEDTSSDGRCGHADFNPLDRIYDCFDELRGDSYTVEMEELIDLARDEGMSSSMARRAIATWVELEVMQYEGQHIRLKAGAAGLSRR